MESAQAKDAVDVAKENIEDESREKETKEEEILVQPSKLNMKMLKLLNTPNKEASNIADDQK